MSEIAEHIVPNSILLFNESFAATNEREGSEIATQIVRALLEKGMKVFYVTHLYEFARGFFNEKDKGDFPACRTRSGWNANFQAGRR